MKRIIISIVALLLLIGLLAGCGNKTVESDGRSLPQSRVWSLSARYPVNYSSMQFLATYDVNGEFLCMEVTRSAKETGSSKRVIEARTVDGIVYALCGSQQTNDDGSAQYTYYECYTGSFRYVIGNESSGSHVEDVLSLDQAIAMIGSPYASSEGIRFQDAEWNAQFRTDACNLEILIRPNDGGALVRSLSSSHEAQAENGETYYVSSNGDEIVYTDGVNSVQIRQANRAGTDQQNYLTVSECKEILSLLSAA